MDNEKRSSIVDWDESEVHSWLSQLGFPQYESQIKEHRISGDILCMLDTETLKSVGVSTIGQRLAILKAIYQAKLAQNIPLEPDAYIPPSEAPERMETVVERLNATVIDQGHRLRYLEEENRHLHQQLQSMVDDLQNLKSSLGSNDDTNDLRRQPSFKWAQYKPTKSPTKAELESPHPSPPQPSPQQMENDTSRPPLQQNPSNSDRSGVKPSPQDSPNTSGHRPKPLRQESTDNLNKSFKVSLEDPTYKVLPAALKKYRINNDNWENYAMFICYGSPGNRIERCLSYDEKPLLLFQKLKDAKKNPVFMLKHIKDIRSPIVVAQQKHAARKASSAISNEGIVSATTPGHTKSASQRTIHRPPKLEVNDLSTPAPSGLSPQPAWPEPGIASPSVDPSKGEDMSNGPPVSAGVQSVSQQSTNFVAPSTTAVANQNGHESAKSRGGDPGEPPLSNGSGREIPAASSSGVSYAVAIYPYMAEQDDEFDVVVGDTFIILSRSRGWWVVQRDPTGAGIVDTSEPAKQGWVPAGCLLETSVPVASAIAEAKQASGSQPESPSKTPILPLSIISTSFPGIALMDYKKKGDEELDLAKDDQLRVFKRYNHWSYAVKEDGGDRGWVPSWFIGKVAPTGQAPPATPSTSAPPALSSGDEPTVNGQPQVSPMSSAFPSVQTRI